MKTLSRIEWSELRNQGGPGIELFFVIAEPIDGGIGWTFYERSSWDVSWIQVTPRLSWLFRVVGDDGRSRPPIKHPKPSAISLRSIRGNSPNRSNRRQAHHRPEVRWLKTRYRRSK